MEAKIIKSIFRSSFKFLVLSKSLTLSLLLVVFSSCEKKSKDVSHLPVLLQDSARIVSTRPQSSNPFLGLIQLKEPALLTQAQISQGITAVDQTLLQKITTDQEKLIAELNAFSSEVQVVYKYKYVLNAIAIVAPESVFEKFSSDLILKYENVSSFERPIVKVEEREVLAKATDLLQKNSSSFIGAQALNNQGLTGKGLKVGIIDSGIDYTHSFFKGVGTAESYLAIDPVKEALGFPNERVRGGVDLVGSAFDTSSENFNNNLPVPDLNPLDEGGHGSHVAGTVAGLGDGVESYNGIAPEADLYAIKVFGAEGSTSDMAVIAGLEYAVDPNGDGDLRDQLDVVNLSLGGGFGNPKILYSEAIKNLTLGGTLAVISAGNSGPTDYVVGAPSTATDALSVAASVDDTFHTWNFDVVEFDLNGDLELARYTDAATTVPAQKSQVSGSLVYIGLAAQDLTSEQTLALQGKVAAIDRGEVSFNDKVKRAANAGAIGVVVLNNAPGALIRMGTEEAFTIPAVMVSQEIGNKIKSTLAQNQAVKVNFKSNEKFKTPEVIDTITSFSSKGPRSIDGFLKPEITAPGFQIISVDFKTGSGVVKLNGTSMSAPHVTGAAILIKQAFLKRGIYLTASELKNVIMGTAKTLSIAVSGTTQIYPVSRQGSGRIQVDVAAASEIVAAQPSISFGEIDVETKKTVSANIQLKNFSTQEKELSVEFVGLNFISMSKVQNLNLEPGIYTEVKLKFTLDATLMGDAYTREMDGWVIFKSNNKEVYRIPVLAVAHKLSSLKIDSLKVKSTQIGSFGAATELQLTNKSQNSGTAHLFNFLARDNRKPLDSFSTNSDCDLQSLGYRIVQKNNLAGEKIDFLELGIKIYKPLTSWRPCHISLLIDSDLDGQIDQEILGSQLSNIAGLPATLPGLVAGFATTVIDFKLAQQIRKKFESDVAAVINDAAALAEVKEDYSTAVLAVENMTVYNNSTVALLQAPIKHLKKDEKNVIHFKALTSSYQNSTVEFDDYLVADSKIHQVSIEPFDQGFVDLADTGPILPQKSLTVDFVKGRGAHSLLILMPQNQISFSNSKSDQQSKVIKPVFIQPLD